MTRLKDEGKIKDYRISEDIGGREEERDFQILKYLEGEP